MLCKTNAGNSFVPFSHLLTSLLHSMHIVHTLHDAEIRVHNIMCMLQQLRSGCCQHDRHASNANQLLPLRIKRCAMYRRPSRVPPV